MFVLINGVEHSILDTGYYFYDNDKGLCIYLSIEDKINTEDNSSFIFQLPLDATEEWFQLIECESYWRIIFRNHYVGNHRDMDLISEGKILVKQLEEKNNNEDCKYQVAFEIILSDETKAVADIQTIFIYNNVPVWGK